MEEINVFPSGAGRRDYNPKYNESGTNVDLLTQAVEWVEWQDTLPNRKQEWYQGAWATEKQSNDGYCGTAYCMAGYIAEQTLSSNERMVLGVNLTREEFREDESMWDDIFENIEAHGPMIIDRGADVKEAWQSGDFEHVSTRATRLLFKTRKFHKLWSGVNDANDIRAYAEHYAGQKL